MRKRRVDGVDIIGNMADDVTGGVGIKVIHLETHKLFKQLLTHGADDPLAHVEHDHRQHIRKGCRKHIAQDHADHIMPHPGKVHAAGERIDGFTGVFGAQQGELIGQQCKHHRRDEQVPVVEHIAAESYQDAPGGFAVQFCFRLTQQKHLPSGIR